MEVKNMIKEGKWEDFFDFELPEIFITKEKPNTCIFSEDYTFDKVHNIPNSAMEISVYSLGDDLDDRILKIKFYLDRDDKLKDLNFDSFLKKNVYSYTRDEILYSLGPEIKLIAYRDLSVWINIRESSRLSSDIVFSVFKEKFKAKIPEMEKSLIKLVKKDIAQINDYISIKLETNLIRVYCKEKMFWTFVEEDILRKNPLDLYQINMTYPEWFNKIYIPQAGDRFQPLKLKFKDVSQLFQKWVESDLKNVSFSWHFYSHLMSRLIEAGHPKAKTIYLKERKIFQNQQDLREKEIEKRKLEQKGKWSEFFDFEIPKTLTQLDTGLEFWKGYSYDKNKLIPRSILEIAINTHEESSNIVLEAKYYLERGEEMIEIEYERGTFYKYSDFLGTKDAILYNLGEEIKLEATLEGNCLVSFSNPEFIKKEIIFTDFKLKLKKCLAELDKDYGN